MSAPGVEDGARHAVRRYHERTKHHPRRYARSLGYLDWATQPDPFRRYAGTPVIALSHPESDGGPEWDELFTAPPPPRPPDHGAISELFYYGLALSAWKQAGSSRWSLRVNPSSGDLHPTEAYLIAGPRPGLDAHPALYHYAPDRHALELRLRFTEEEWGSLLRGLPGNAVLVALSSIPWRESWKYGERAYRYCQHDAGHAIACVAFAARLLGWQARLVEGIPDSDLDELLGLRTQRERFDVEAEHPDCLLALTPASGPWSARVELPDTLRARLAAAELLGTPNRLSGQQHPWPVIEETITATRYAGEQVELRTESAARPCSDSAKRRTPAAPALIRRRRSAVSMDGRTTMPRADFYRLLARLAPASCPFPHEVFPWPSRVSLAFFVHRVEGLSPGLYLLARAPGHLASLRASLDRTFAWETPADLPKALDFFKLLAADLRETAQLVSCEQEIAADGIFSLGMLAQFDTALAQGAWNYPRLYWECGLLGQILYLEAEAAGVRGTGIGCYFDDVMHELLGIAGSSWQSLYHFTVGGALDDPRLQTLPAYHHLREGRRQTRAEKTTG